MIFNRDHIEQFHTRAQKNFSAHNFLFEFAKTEILERLAEIKRDFSNKYILGNRTKLEGFDNIPLCKNIFENSEILPLEPLEADCIVSILDLHNIHDLPNYLLQLRHALKPDGVFIAALFGGETLFELRHALLHAEIETLGGASPRVHPFADKPQMGALMQRAGFALPVIDSEIIRPLYPTMFNLMADLRGMGEQNALSARYKKFTPAKLFALAAEEYQRNFADPSGYVNASFEIIFLIGWAPHESQQKPQKRGSAEKSLADHLETKENKI